MTYPALQLLNPVLRPYSLRNWGQNLPPPRATTQLLKHGAACSFPLTSERLKNNDVDFNEDQARLL